ncbi:hypothetical protein Tco_1166371 [Tanacetum coccineum]
MTTINQGMSVEEIKRVVAQRVANAIEAIAIYETKTDMARKSMSQTERQEDKVAENASNKRKYEGINKPAHVMAVEVRENYKSGCLIVKFLKCMDIIHGGVRASKPKIMQDAIEFATKLMEKKISTPAECQAENKRKLDNNSKNNQNQQQLNKRQNISRAYTAGHGEKKHYSGSKRCVLKLISHDGPCAPMPRQLGASQKAIAMNVEIKGTTGETAQSKRTKTMKTKLEVLEQVEWTRQYLSMGDFGTDIQEKDKKKAKNKQNRARSGKDQVKSKSKVIHMKKIQLEGLKLPNRKLYYKRKRQGSKIANQAKIAFKLYNLRGPKLPTSQKAIFPAPKPSTKGIEGSDLLENPLSQQAHLFLLSPKKHRLQVQEMKTSAINRAFCKPLSLNFKVIYSFFLLSAL